MSRHSNAVSTRSFAGLSVRACVVALAVAFFLFILIAADVMNDGALASVDTSVKLWLHTHSTAGLTTFLRWVSRLHSNWIAGIVTIGICVYLWRRRLRHWVLTFVLTIFGGMLLNTLLKLWFVRPRPDIGGVIYISRSYSFPSGHTMLATVFYGTLCVFLVSRLRDRKSRGLAILSSVLMIAMVGFSRMYLGAHYLTDVLAGIMEGIGWIAGCLLLIEIVRRRRKA